MVAMLLHGSTRLPANLSTLSPWIDSDFGVADAEKAALSAQYGRRVVKTHTPADGFPVWEGVTFIAVYRHPLDLFFSLRKHIANVSFIEDHAMKQPVGASLEHYLHTALNLTDWDNDSLAHVCHHYAQTCQSDRWPGMLQLHYSDMLADHRGTVAKLAEVLGIAAEEALIDAVTQATEFAAMKADAARYAPEVNAEIWNDETAFFDSGQSGKWKDRLSPAQIASYQDALANFVPDAKARRWLEFGSHVHR